MSSIGPSPGCPCSRRKGITTAFPRVLLEALAEHPTRLLAYCVLPNHWHLDLWPREDGELTAFVRWLMHTHSMRWHTHYHTLGNRGGTGSAAAFGELRQPIRVGLVAGADGGAAGSGEDHEEEGLAKEYW